MKFDFSIAIYSTDKMFVCVVTPTETSNIDLFAYYLCLNGQIIDRIPYSKKNICQWNLQHAGVYRVKCYMKRRNQKVARYSTQISYFPKTSTNAVPSFADNNKKLAIINLLTKNKSIKILDYETCCSKYSIFSKYSTLVTEKNYYDYSGKMDYAKILPQPKLIKYIDNQIKLDILEINNALVIRNLGIITPEGDLIHQCFCGRFVNTYIQINNIVNTCILTKKFFRDLMNLKIGSIDEKCFYMTSPQSGYGHVILEMLPKLWAIEHINDKVKIIFFPDREGYPHFIETFGLHNQIAEDLSPVMFCKTLYVATQPLFLYDYCTHDAINIWNKIGFNALNHAKYNLVSEENKRIFLSRRNYKSKRVLENNNEIESIFAENGFAIISPESMDIPSQLQLLSKANIIAAPYGSAIFNCLFSQQQSYMFLLYNNELFLKHLMYYDEKWDISAYKGEISRHRRQLAPHQAKWHIADLKDLRNKVGLWLDRLP